MQEVTKKAAELKKTAEELVNKLDINKLSSELTELEKQSSADDFWQDSQSAQAVMIRISELQSRVEPWQKLQKIISDIEELAALNDPSLEKELKDQIKLAEDQLAELREELKYNGPYDDHSAIISIHAGAGGTDAQDWSQMLLRMYTRWADKHKYKINTIEQSSGDEAGIKSVTFEINGSFIFGQLRGEHGVHRLVRLSPFNADNLRQTSFAKVEVMPKMDKPNEVEIDPKDLKIDVFRAGGHGGQSVNTTDSAVRITHIPSGIVVSIQNERSQLQNKEAAMTILRSQLAQLQLEQHQDDLSKIKGPNESAEWGNQIRSYVLHPYKQVKDNRTKYETSNAEEVLDGNIDEFISAYLNIVA
jgi:peptide chain release factor 2